MIKNNLPLLFLNMCDRNYEVDAVGYSAGIYIKVFVLFLKFIKFIKQNR